jgi:cysteine desulfurase / selenocysteine lyase
MDMSLGTQIRADFPFFERHRDFAYLDNACMSIRPRPVLEAMTHYYEDLSGCAGRSNHRLAQAVTEKIDEVRGSVQRFIHAKKASEIVFTRNTTEGINLVANSLGLVKGDVVVISDKEHNSNLVPWLYLRDRVGIELRVMKTSRTNEYVADNFESLLDEKVKLVSVVQTSNLDGVSFPVEEMVQKAHEIGSLVLVDAAQSIPHGGIDVSKLNVDFAVFSGHKMMGPTGTGVLYGKYKWLDAFSGFMVGGDTVERTSYENFTLLPPPEKFEAGLQDYAGIIGLGAAIDYLEQIGLKQIREYELGLNQLLTESLEDQSRIQLIGPTDYRLRGSIYSFYVDGGDSHQIALMLDQAAKIMVRSGQHCVHSWFEGRGIAGSVRASLYAYTTEEEVIRFCSELKKILTVI